LLDRLDVLNARDILRYWPVLLIFYGIIVMRNHKKKQG
jgi:hypothetical protein